MKKTLAMILTISFFMLIGNNTYANFLEQKLDESSIKELLSSGELIHLKEENGKLKNIDYAIIIDVPLEKAWQVITDFENYPNFIPGNKSCKIINYQGNEIIVESTVEFKFIGIGSTINYTTKYILQKPGIIIFDTERNREIGRYKFIPIDEGKRVVLFRTKEIYRDNLTGIGKILIDKNPELESSLYLSPLMINIKAIKERVELSKIKKG